MSNYDFHRRFEPMEFEEFVRDVLQVREQLVFESFKEGKDEGIDGRYISNNGKTIIIQAKRWKVLNKGELREEKEKMDIIKPDRYILGLSMDLNPKQKREIIEILNPYIKNPEDIISEKDFNNLLDLPGYRIIIDKYYKLWIENTQIMRQIMTEAVCGILLEESRQVFKEAIERTDVFVETTVYSKALKQLKSNKVIIIAGEPGVGKTTLACQLAIYYYYRKGFDTFIWAKTVDDLFAAQKIGNKRVLVFDDFWGSTFQESSIAGKDEQRLARFIERIYGQQEYVLLLTTREYILEQGLKKHADLREIIEKYKLEYTLEEYSDVDKVQIYFGHLKQSKLTWKQLHQLFYAHESVIQSPNYNPRVIDMFLKNVDTKESPEQCEERFFSYLENPDKFWSAIFEGLSEEARTLYMLLNTFPVPARLDDLKESFCNVIDCQGNPVKWKDFGSTIAELEKTVIKTINLPNFNVILVKFLNPSAYDFIFEYLVENFRQYKRTIILACNYFEQYIYLLLYFSKGLSDEEYSHILAECVDKIHEKSIISEIHNDCITDNELEYYENYTESDTLFERYYKLLKCFDKNKNLDNGDFFSKFMQKYLGKLAEEPWSIYSKDLEIFPEVIKEYTVKELYLNANDVMTIYLECIIKSRTKLELEKFQEIFPDLYQGFLLKHISEIKKYIEKYYREDLCSFAVEGEQSLFFRTYNESLKEFEKYGIACSPDWKQEIDEYSSWISQESEKPADKEDDGDWEESRVSYEQAVRSTEEDIFGISPLLFSEDIRDMIKGCSLQTELKQQLITIMEKEEPWFIYDFMREQNSFAFLEKFFNYTGNIAENILLFTLQLSCFLSGQDEIYSKKLTRFLIEFGDEVIWRESVVLTGEEIINSQAYQTYFDDEEYFNQLVSGGLFIANRQWYELPNILLVMLPYTLFVSGMETEDKKIYYKNLISEQEWPPKKIVTKKLKGKIDADIYMADIGYYNFYNPHYEYLLYKALEFLDYDCYLEFAVCTLAREYCNKFKNLTDIEIVYGILNDIELEIEVNKQGEVIGGMNSASQLWIMLENLDIINVCDLIPEYFDRNQMSVIKQNFYLVNNKDEEYYQITFKEAEDTEFIEKIGCIDPVLSAYGKINALCETTGGDVVI